MLDPNLNIAPCRQGGCQFDRLQHWLKGFSDHLSSLPMLEADPFKNVGEFFGIHWLG